MTFRDMHKVKSSCDDKLRIGNKQVYHQVYGVGHIVKFVCHGTKAHIRFNSGVLKILDIKDFKR